MSPVALVLAAALAAPPDGSASGETVSPVLAAPPGTALSLEGRAGGATCGYCGLMLGIAVLNRGGLFQYGAFVEVAAPVSNASPTSTKPTRIVGSYFLGGQAGVVGEVRGGHRIGVAAEGGAQLASAKTVYTLSSGIPGRSRSEVIPVVGLRAAFEVRLSGGGLLGLAAFVREPLLQPCMDVGLGCDPPGTTYGVVVQGSLDFR